MHRKRANISTITGGEKIYLQQQTDKIYLKFAPDTNKEQIRKVIGKDTSSLLMSKANLDNTSLRFAVLESKNERTAISTSTLESYKARAEVVSANYLFEYNGQLLGLTDEFIVKLKETTSYNQLEELALKNYCKIGLENEFVKNKYLIYVSKTSHLDAMQMANLFYETGLFDYSSPNHVLFNVLLSNDTYFGNQWGLKNTGQYGGISGMDINVEQIN